MVYGSMLNAQEWNKAKGAGAIVPAGRLCPSPMPYSDDPNAQSADLISEANWTEGMKNIAAYSAFLGRELMGVENKVLIVNTQNMFLACYGKGQVHFNVQHLGSKWFEQGANEIVDRLLIHEFGHQYSGDHLSDAYHEALCRLGAGIKRLSLEKPDELRRFMK